jgi:cell wall-associated NlpC family hydrolase
MTRERFIHAALSFLQIPYRWGGDDPAAGFDCSGLVQELLAILGLDAPGDQTADNLYRHCLVSGAPEGVLDTGSLVFYGTKERVTHVAMILEGETIIEAGGGGSKTSDLQSAILQNAFVRLRPLRARKDLVGVYQPKGLPWNRG